MDIRRKLKNQLKHINTVGSIIDIYPQNREYQVALAEDCTDAEAIFQDWQAVGGFLTQAGEAYQESTALDEAISSPTDIAEYGHKREQAGI